MHWSTNRALTTIARHRHGQLDAALDDAMHRDQHTIRMDIQRAADVVKAASEAGTTTLDVTSWPADHTLAVNIAATKKPHHLRVRCTRAQHAVYYEREQLNYRWGSPDCTRIVGLPVEYAD